MHFALLGNHPDGLKMALALVESSRHEFAAYSGPPIPWEKLGIRPDRVIGDIEEILADPKIDAVIVAGDLSQRPNQLRRALQSERHVLCVYPPSDSPDITYEAAMIQSDTRRVLLPLLLGSLHPGVQRLRELIQTDQPSSAAIRLIEWKQNRNPKSAATDGTQMEHGKESVLNPHLIGGSDFDSGYFPGWEVLQALGGPIAEVSAFAEQTIRPPHEPLLVAGRFEHGGLFQAVLSPFAPEGTWRLRLTASSLRAELDLSCSNKAHLSWTDAAGAAHQEEWDSANPYREMVRVFENAVRVYEQGTSASGSEEKEPRQEAVMTWQDAIRAAELDDAARRSVERRRVSALEYPEATEEASFKGTMTLIGCGMLWLILVLLVLSRWFPVLLFVIVIMLTVFLCLQVLRAIVRKSEKP
jgi:predicted dehydrogenase